MYYVKTSSLSFLRLIVEKNSMYGIHHCAKYLTKFFFFFKGLFLSLFFLNI